MKNPNEPMGNRTHDLPAYSAVPHPTAQRIIIIIIIIIIISRHFREILGFHSLDIGSSSLLGLYTV